MNEVQAYVGPGAEAPRWWKCDTHGAARAGAWGCPECVRELRGEKAVLEGWITSALGAEWLAKQIDKAKEPQ